MYDDHWDAGYVLCINEDTHDITSFTYPHAPSASFLHSFKQDVLVQTQPS